MKGLDTNVLVRYLVKDDPDQATRAVAWVTECAEQGVRCYLAEIVLCEMVWVLSACYDRSRQEIAATLERLLETEQIEVEGVDRVRGALADFAIGPGDFADYLIGRGNHDAACDTTVTFDRRLEDHPDFTVL